MSAFVAEDAHTFVYTILKDCLSQLKALLKAHMQWGETGESGTTLLTPQHRFPDELPSDYQKGLVLLDNQVPALPISATLRDHFLVSIAKARRQRRIEQVLSMDVTVMNEQVIRNREKIAELQRKRAWMAQVLEEQETHHNGPFLSDDEFKELERLITKLEDINENCLQVGKRVDTELKEERNEAIRQYFELADVLHSHFEVSGLLPTDTDQAIEDRRSFGWHTRHMYKRANRTEHEFVRDFLVRDWAKRDAGIMSDEEISRASGSVASAINAFDTSHWNRMIARDDFEHMDELVWNAEPRYDSWEWREREEANENIPRESFHEKRRITRNLIEAESKHRQAVRRLRRLGQSVHTNDSTHLSAISTAPPSIDEYYTARMQMLHNLHVRDWRENVPPHSSSDLSGRSIVTDLETMHVGTAISQTGGKLPEQEYLATKQRAWHRENEKRDRQEISCRRRVKRPRMDDAGSSQTRDSGSDGGSSVPRSRTRHALSGDRYDTWPERELPARKSAARGQPDKSFSST